MTPWSRRQRAQFRVLILRVDREVIFDFLHVVAKEPELSRLRVVADVDVGFEGGLVAVDLVVVGFVRSESDVDRRVQIHPGHVAAVVIVVEEGQGASLKKCFQRQISRQRGGLAKEPGAFGEVFLVRVRILDGPQRSAGAALDNGEEAFRFGALLGRQRSDPELELLLAEVLGIKARAERFAQRNARQKRFVVVEIGKGTFVKPEGCEAGFSERCVVAFQLLVKRGIAGPHLAEKYVVEDTRRFDQLHERAAVSGRELARIDAKVDRREFRDHFLQFRQGRIGGG